MSTKKKKINGLKSLEKRLGKLSVGEFLRTWRTTEEMTPMQFGKLTGLSIANLCDIEKGRKGVSPEKAEQIAKAIGVPPAFLVRLSIEESLQSAGLRYKVEIKPAERKTKGQCRNLKRQTQLWAQSINQGKLGALPAFFERFSAKLIM
jgi:antitoxin HigA-1